MQKSCIFWEGASTIDGAPIVVILTGLLQNSSNPKTGAMIQSWILRQDELPLIAAQTGKDTSICGNCPLKFSNNNICYVGFLGVNNIWRKYKAGRYAPMNEQSRKIMMLLRTPLRLGSYGDPTAVPLDVWRPLLKMTRHTGYTHQHHYCDQDWRHYIMASVESVSAAHSAQSRGWRTFRIAQAGTPILDNEIVCTNQFQPEIQCKDCFLCDGCNRKPNIVAYVHGWKVKKNNFNKLGV